MTAETLLQTWSAPARRRAQANDALLAAPVVVAIAAVAGRLLGWGWGAAVLIVGLVAIGAWLWRRGLRFDRGWLTRALDSRRPDLEDSTGLIFADAGALNGLQALQRSRLLARLESGRPQALANDWSRRPILILWLAAVVIVAGALLWPRAGDRPATLAPANEGGAAAPGVPRLVGQNLRIHPPAYTGLPVRDEPKLDARAPVGSRLEWTLKFAPDATAPALLRVGEDVVRLNRSGDVWTATQILGAPFLYRVDGAGGRGPTPPLHRIDAVADLPPEIKAISPTEALTRVSPGQRGWSPVFEASDDYGVNASARLRVTLAMGEGENVVFTEREIGVSGSGPARRRRFAPRLDFGALGFGPGGDLVVQLIVSDNRSPGPQVVRGPSLILRWPSNAEQSTGLEGMVNTTLPAYFRSQRQIIIDAEGLIARRRRLSDDRYLAASNVIGNDQQILRGRYSQFLGGENAGQPQLPTSDAAEVHTDDDGHDHGPPAAAPQGFGAAEDVLATYGHPHDDSAASALDPQTRAVLRQAVDAMWRSEEQLKLGRPDLALPHANAALNFIKEVQRATRIFLARTGSNLPPVDPARRMTGKREGIGSRTLGVAAVEGDDAPAAEAWRALAGSGPVTLDEVGRWARANAGRLPDPLALAGAIDSVRQEPDCADCRARLRAELWRAMERPAGAVQRRPAADATGARYLGAIGGAP